MTWTEASASFVADARQRKIRCATSADRISACQEIPLPQLPMLLLGSHHRDHSASHRPQYFGEFCESSIGITDFESITKYSASNCEYPAVVEINAAEILCSQSRMHRAAGISITYGDSIMKSEIHNNRRRLLTAAAAILAASLASSSFADVLRGPIVFGPNARIRLDCPSTPTASNIVQSDVQGFGHVSYPVKFKLQYKPDVYSTFVDVPNSEIQTRDYIQSLNSFLGNFPGPGYYALVMRNTNAFSVTLPANEQLGIICR